jgi:hypothetical protein
MLKIKPLLFLLLALGLVLAGCGQLTPPEAATRPAEPVATSAEPAAAEPTAAEQAAAAAPTLGVPTPVGPVIAACRPETSSQVDPALADQFPKVGPDWAKGPDSAFLSIIEYSDFQ